MIEFKRVAFGSDEYRQMLAVREDILRKPLGLRLSEEDCGQDKTDWQLAAIRDGQVVATLLVRALNGKTAKLRQMAVLESERGSGVGQTLLSFAEAEITKAGMRDIVLHARSTAIGFYEKSGYACEGDEFDEQTIPHIRMRKSL